MTNYPHAKKQAEFYALIAEHGEENVEWRGIHGSRGPHNWVSAARDIPRWDVEYSYEFHFKKQTGSIHVDGLPLPETQAPGIAVDFFVLDLSRSEWCFRSTWAGVPIELSWLDRGLVYLNEEDAITAAKAMRVTGTY